MWEKAPRSANLGMPLEQSFASAAAARLLRTPQHSIIYVANVGWYAWDETSEATDDASGSPTAIAITGHAIGRYVFQPTA